jgi:hypothetical protein
VPFMPQLFPFIVPNLQSGIQPGTLDYKAHVLFHSLQLLRKDAPLIHFQFDSVVGLQYVYIHSSH